MIQARPCQRAIRWYFAGAAVLLLWIALTGRVEAQAADPNEACYTCHAQPGLTVKLTNGDILPLTMDPNVFRSSVHGKAGHSCTTCHTNITGYPHPPLTAGDRRSFQLERYTQCKPCHTQQYNETLDSNHARALAAGDRNAAVCTDCHGAHDISDPKTPRVKMAQVCEKCHSAIYGQYRDSVHGAALAEESNPDVATCQDCHGVHRQEDPTTAAFRLKSPNICGGCHANDAMMRKYGISTEVFESYVADFHGTTVRLFEKRSPDQPTNKAVCYDCHGIHNILPITDESAMVAKKNLLTTCKACHPDATEDFPDSWVGHFRPSPTNNPLVYYVNLFYRILIPTVIGGMLAFVLLDAFRRIVNRFQRRGA